MNEKTRLKKESQKRKVPFICNEGKQLRAQKVNRNDLCPCGSKKKAKKCCKPQTRYFTKKDKVKEGI